MGLSATLLSGVSKAFEAVGDVKKEITFHKVTLGSYDPATDVRSDTVVDHTINVVESTIKTTEQDWTEVLRDSKKLLFAAADVTFTPEPNDYVTMDGATWEIIKINAVPGDSEHIIFVRQP